MRQVSLVQFHLPGQEHGGLFLLLGLSIYPNKFSQMYLYVFFLLLLCRLCPRYMESLWICECVHNLIVQLSFLFSPHVNFPLCATISFITVISSLISW
jgi:hypothetical protein